MIKINWDRHAWRRYRRVTNPIQFRRKGLELIIRRLLFMAYWFANKMKEEIDRGPGRRNKPLTVKIKGSDHPLLHTGRLRNAVKVVPFHQFAVFIGYLKSDPVPYKSGRKVSSMAELAHILHEGRIISTSPRMRKMFGLLTAVSEGKMSASVLTGRAKELWDASPGKWWPIRKRFLRIPPRRWIMMVATRKRNRDFFEMHMRKWIQQALNKGL